ncbi:MAG: hypothetical protein K8R36_18915 [Planctomycetales bacterium]|nr:hypothetical protein [Planctomycetales bacterium]
MNRSFHAFAVLLVSLAGGIIAATWTSTLPSNRSVMHPKSSSEAVSPRLHCSCNPDSLVRLEQGCARDKTTGELYGCGLGLGKNGTSGKSIIGRTTNSAINSFAKSAVAFRDCIAQLPWQKLATQSQRLEKEFAEIQSRMPSLKETPQHERDYAAAELAAADFDPVTQESPRLNLNQRIAPLYRTISPDAVEILAKSTLALLQSVSRQLDRQSRLWLVEAGLHQQWDAAEETVVAEQLVASARLRIDDETVERWFENFPPPVTQPNRLINPIEPKVDDENSRQMILATAKALETLSDLLHQSAENLARHAEQDVAELHKLKSGIEERR